MNRICIYTKDIQLITGKGQRQCREIINQIKKLHHKEKHQQITIYELSAYLGVQVERIQPLIR